MTFENSTQKPKIKSANECMNMQEVRYEIDRLDEILVALIAERQSFMDAAARIKGKRELIRDEARIQDVLNKVLIQAEKQNLSPEIAIAVWRNMIEACIDYEMKAFEKMQQASRLQPSNQ